MRAFLTSQPSQLICLPFFTKFCFDGTFTRYFLVGPDWTFGRGSGRYRRNRCRGSSFWWIACPPALHITVPWQSLAGVLAPFNSDPGKRIDLDIFYLSWQYFAKSCPKTQESSQTQGKFPKNSIHILANPRTCGREKISKKVGVLFWTGHNVRNVHACSCLKSSWILLRGGVRNLFNLT